MRHERCCRACSRSAAREPASTTDDVRAVRGRAGLPAEGRAQKLPDEPRRLAVVLSGRRGAEFWDDAAGRPPAAARLLRPQGRRRGARGRPAPAGRDVPAGDGRPYLHPGRAAELLVDGKPVGAFGELHPKVAAAFDLASGRCWSAELDLEAILAAVPERFAYTPVPRFPAALRDIAVVVPTRRAGRARAGRDPRRRRRAAAPTCGCSTCTAARPSRPGRRAWRTP